MKRRQFLGAAAGAGLAALAAPRRAFAADASVVLSPAAAGPTISPHLYGHFIEHLGGVMYDGIWVGRDSKIPNVDGHRKQFVDDMKRIGAPNLRWPGGCFADGYHWRDGIGPAAARPRTYNYWEHRMPKGVPATETNQFGIHEFMRLCRLVGAEPYLAANVGSATPQEFHDWVSYCNAPAGTLSLADERARNGDAEPFKVKYWGVGNESWGCGGNMSGGEYATEYRKYIAQVPVYEPPFFVAVGPRGHSADSDVGWTDGFFAGLQSVRGLGVQRGRLRAALLHRLSADRGGRRPLRREGLVRGPARRAPDREGDRRPLAHHGASYDPEHRTKFVIDEWGNWYKGGTELGPAYILSQAITLRDALHTAITFDVFNRHADKIAMANVAQTINCLHSLFAAVGDKYARTPVYYAFEMYRPHMGARLVPLRIEAPELSVELLSGSGRLPALSGSASVRDSSLCVTLTNPSLDDAVRTSIRLEGGGRVAEARGRVLTHEDMKATNTFDRPNNVTLGPVTVEANADGARVTIPARAVVALELRIA